MTLRDRRRSAWAAAETYRRSANGARGQREAALGAPPVFLFEPHQPEPGGWAPNVLLDIPPVWEKERAVIGCMARREHLWDDYTRAALQRGAQAARNSGRTIADGEGYEAVFPHVVKSLA